VNVGIVIVTHGTIGDSLIQAAEFILGCSLDRIGSIAVTQSGPETPDVENMREVISKADAGKGVLVLTDLACASPSNIVEQLLQDRRARVVSGVNLSMLLRAWNYREESLDSLAERAFEGGIRGIEIRE
jgi:PTS system mannose-specific IIA component